MIKSSISTQSSSTTLVRAREATQQLGDWYILTATPEVQLAERVMFAKQVHSGNIVRAANLIDGETEADGILLEGAGHVVGIYTADCAPVVIVAGERALALHISRKTLAHGLLDNVGTYLSGSEIDHIWVGPHICEYHFDFDREGEELRAFRYRFPEAVHFHKGKLFLSLKVAMDHYFSAWQVHPDKIVRDGRCSYEKVELPSRKRWLAEGQEDELGHLATVVWHNAPTATLSGARKTSSVSSRM